MKYETSVVYLEQLPKVVVDTGFDWASLWTFFATIAVFMLGTYLTIRNFNRTVVSQEGVAAEAAKIQKLSISSQEVIARQNSLKASRQNWINDLRDTTAQFIAAAQNVQRLLRYWDAAQPSWAAQRASDLVTADKIRADWSTSHMLAMKELESLKAKIELLLNPDEMDSKEFMKAIRALHEDCNKAGGAVNALSDNVVWWCQGILKEEWEKAKRGE